MNHYFASILLGIIKGLTEFLPVSSTAHLRLVMQPLLGAAEAKTPFWEMYTIFIQLGAILALPVFFWSRILKFIRTFPNGERRNRTALTHPLTLVFIAFVITAGPMYVLTHKKIVDKNLENLHMIAWALLVGGVIMWLVDAMFRRPTTLHMEEMTLPQAIWIGACQILSGVFPGTSRSMATIAAGQSAAMSRGAALEFSFFLSMPTMAAATLYALYKWLYPKDATGNPVPHPPISAEQWIVLSIGFVVSFIVALVVVAWFMHWVRRRGFIPFAIYRIVLGIGVLCYLWTHKV